MDDHDLECPHGDYWSACPICKANHRKANPPADAARDVIAEWYMRTLSDIFSGSPDSIFGGIDAAVRLIAALTAAGYEIVQRGDGVRVSREDANDCLTLAAEECDLYEGSANKWDDAEYRHFTGLHKRLAAALAAGADPA